jgi:hypothetical protein
MKIGFAPVSTVDVKHVSLLSELEQKLNNFFQSKHYGEDLKELQINVIAVNPRMQRFFTQWQNPQYIFNRKDDLRGMSNNFVGRTFKYGIRLNFERFNSANETEAKEMLKTEVLSSLSLFDRFKNKIKDFNPTPFRQDMKCFFEEVAV